MVGSGLTLEVLSFYTKRKLNVLNSLDIVATSIYFHILIKQDVKVRELVAFIPRKYKFKRTLLSSNFEQEKLLEYNVLVDFIEDAKERLIPKWHISEEDLLELKEELLTCLIQNHCSCPAWKEVLLKYLHTLKIVILRFIRGKVK